MKMNTSRASLTLPAQQSLLSNYLALTKFRLLGLVLVSTSLGYYLAAPERGNFVTLVSVLFGVALVGGGANVLNQWYERDIDALMHRTQKRPLPSGTISPKSALAFGLGISLSGFLIISLWVNTTTALLSFISWVSYLFIYTPLKIRSVLNTWVGAVPGALPSVLGWTAVTGSSDWGTLSLFLILYFWQLPHFFAISWVHREDYKLGGFKMLSWNDPEGNATSVHIVIDTFLLIAVSSSLFITTESGLVYLLSALVLGVIFLLFALGFYRKRSTLNARKVFRFSIIYLPLLFLVIVIDRLIA